MNDVFLSYAREDRDPAQRLAAALEGRGWTVWWDKLITTGKTFDEVIQQALDDTRTVVVLWSEHSIRSSWVKDEAAEGARRGILVPCRIDDVRIPLGFGRIQTASLIDWDGDPDHPGLQQLQTAIAASIEASKMRATGRLAAVPGAPTGAGGSAAAGSGAGGGEALAGSMPAAVAATAAWRRFRAPLLGMLAVVIAGGGLAAYFGSGGDPGTPGGAGDVIAAPSDRLGGGSAPGSGVAGAGAAGQPAAGDDGDSLGESTTAEGAAVSDTSPTGGGAVPAGGGSAGASTSPPGSGSTAGPSSVPASGGGEPASGGDSPGTPAGSNQPASRLLWVPGLTFAQAVESAGGDHDITSRDSLSQCGFSSRGDDYVLWVKAGVTGSKCQFRVAGGVHLGPGCRIVDWDVDVPDPERFTWVAAPQRGTGDPSFELRMWSDSFQGRREVELRRVQLSLPAGVPTLAAGDRELIDPDTLAERCFERAG